MPLIRAENVVGPRHVQSLQQLGSALRADDRVLLPLHHQNLGCLGPAFRQVSTLLKQGQILLKPFAAWGLQPLQQLIVW